MALPAQAQLLVSIGAVIYVLIPAFDEAERLRSLLPAVPTHHRGHEIRVLVLCDGSTDGTCAVARDHGVDLIRIRPNRGKGHALRIGAEWLTGRDFDAVVVMDGDGQHDPAYLKFLLHPVLVGTADITIGSRYADQPRRGNTPLNRYLVRSAFSRYLVANLRQQVTDPFSGYRCMSAEAFRKIELRGDRYEGELEVRFEAEIHDFSLIEIPIEKIYRGNQTKMTSGGHPIRSRVRVIRSYLSTTRRKSAELTAAKVRLSVASSR